MLYVFSDKVKFNYFFVFKVIYGDRGFRVSVIYCNDEFRFVFSF